MASSEDYSCGGVKYPKAKFREKCAFSEREKSAIDFHLAFIFDLLRLLEQPPFRTAYESIATIVNFIGDYTAFTLGPFDAEKKDAANELVTLQSVLTEVHKNTTVQGLRDAVTYLDKNFELTHFSDNSQTASMLLKYIHQLGLGRLTTSPTLYKSIIYAHQEACKGSDRPCIIPDHCSKPFSSDISSQSVPAAVSAASETISVPANSGNKIISTDPEIVKFSSKRSKSSESAKDIESDGFQVPKKFAKALTPSTQSTITSNTFDPLLRMETNESDSELKSSEIESSKIETSEIETNPAAPEAANTSNQDRPQPIFLKMVSNYREILQQLTNLSPEVYSKKAIDDLVKISPASIAQYRLFQNFLTERNIQFYAMKPRAERPKKVVLRGLPTDTDIGLIKSELTELGFSVHRISQMRNFRTKIAYPSVICDLYKTEVLPGIFQLGSLLGYQVSVSNFVNKQAKQCFNCQRFGHSSDICTLDPVCLKCSGQHRSNTCSVPRDQIRCCHCGLNHCSNYSKCRKNPKMIREAKLAEEKEAAILKINPFPVLQSTIRPGVNFATATANRNPARARTLQRAPTTSLPPLLNQMNFPDLPSQQQVKPPQVSASTPNTSNLELDDTILKLERIRDLLLQIKSLASDVNALPGLQGLLKSVFP